MPTPFHSWYEKLEEIALDEGIEDMPDGKEYYEKLVNLKKEGYDTFFVIDQDDPSDLEVLMALLRGVHKLIEKTEEGERAMTDYCATVEGWIAAMLCAVVEMEAKGE